MLRFFNIETIYIPKLDFISVSKRCYPLFIKKSPQIIIDLYVYTLNDQDELENNKNLSGLIVNDINHAKLLKKKLREH